MEISFHPDAWEDLLYWQRTDKKLFKRTVALIKEIRRTPCVGMGKPEPLRGDLSGYWSRRIDQEHRLVYAVDDERITVLQCRGHY
ncbi:MAG: Txe/YoeB family addiction module toxin [Bacteroidota bacterium]